MVPAAIWATYTKLSPDMRPEGRDSPSGIALAGLGVAMAAAFVLPLFGGLALDRSLRTTPWGLIGGFVVGILAAVGVVYSGLKRYL